MSIKVKMFFAFTLLITGIAGFLLAKQIYEPSAGSIVVDTNNTIYFTPTSSDNAHLMSRRFRNQAGLCPPNPSCPGLAKGGVFEFSATTIYDLVSAVNVIKNEVVTSGRPVPPFFRAIFGIDATNKTRVIVAGLNSLNVEYPNSIKIIDGHLPCPVMCDVNLSDIIMGVGTNKGPCDQTTVSPPRL